MAKRHNISLTDNQIRLVSNYQAEHQCDFNEALRRILDEYMELKRADIIRNNPMVVTNGQD